MNKKQGFNPYLPNYEYIPDGEPHVFDGRVYLYGSHDRFNGNNFCLNDYVCWSAPVDDLGDWRYEGVIYKRIQDPHGSGPSILKAMYAPDLCKGADGRYYLYYFISGTGLISVAVCDTPAGRFEFYGHIKYPDGVKLGDKQEPLQFDPGIFVDEDGRIYLYTGFGILFNPLLLRGRKPTRHGAMGFELDRDMLTILSGPVYIGVKGRKEGIGTPYEGHEFFEASSMRKFDGKYYFIYSSYEGHELCYAVSDSPLEGFEFGGTLVSIGDVGIEGRQKKDALNYLGNTHGSLIEIAGRHYVFYHRQTNRHQFSRQACAEKIRFEEGVFYQAELTSCGLNDKPLKGIGYYEAAIACHLQSEKGARWYSALKGFKGSHPYLTQKGQDRETDPDQYIANMKDGSTAGFRYFDFTDAGETPKRIRVKISGNGIGRMLVTEKIRGPVMADIDLKRVKGDGTYETTLDLSNKVAALYFTYRGKGAIDFIAFELMA